MPQTSVDKLRSLMARYAPRKLWNRAHLFCKRFLSPYLRWCFWTLVFIVLAVAIGALSLDARESEVYCEAPNPRGSAYLVLTGIDPSSKTLKAALLIPSLDRKKDQLIVGTAAEHTAGTRLTYDPRITIKPDPQANGPSGYIEAQLPYKSSSFWYPFDHATLDLLIDFQRPSGQMPLKVQVNNKINGLILERCVSHYALEDASA